MILQWIDLFFRILKIILLSTVYASLVLLIAYILFKKTQNRWLKNRMGQKFRNWLLIHFLVSVCLLFYSFSYWQDTGLGENPSIPIGYGQRIYSPDFAWTNFYPDLSKTEANKDELQIENFIVKENMLYAEAAYQNTSSANYDIIVCDLSNRTNISFLTDAEYTAYANSRGLPMITEFRNFRTHYKEYFDRQPKWKKWLLP